MQIIGNVARGLAHAHAAGILHRDIKPENILLEMDLNVDGATPATAILCDFGIALPLLGSEGQEGEDRMTEEGSILGTPLYLSPEQCSGQRDLLPACDVYALGITLFEMLAGRPPFMGASALELLRSHLTEEPPRLEAFRDDISAGMADLVARCLAKDPEQRPRDAGAFLAQIGAIQRGKTALLLSHPLLPEPEAKDLVEVHLKVAVAGNVEEVWPLASDTNRFNRALGLPPVNYEIQVNEDGGAPLLFGENRLKGLASRWLENPFEWIEGSRFSVVREFERGPLRWYASAVKLEAVAEDQTLIHHHLWLAPRNALSAAATRLAMNFGTEKKLRRVYEGIAQYVESNAPNQKARSRPYKDGHRLMPTEARRLESGVALLREKSGSLESVQALAEILAHAPAEDAARIRPRVFAREHDTDLAQALDLLFDAAHAGLVSPMWAVICPSCQIPASLFEAMKDLRGHGHCDACQIDFEANIDEDVEFYFRAHPDVRALEKNTYCLGGPHHARHVLAQVRLAPRESFTLALPLEAGTYRLRGGPKNWILPFRVAFQGAAPPIALKIQQRQAPQMEDRIAPGEQALLLENQDPNEVVLRLERVISRRDVFTLAEALAHPRAHLLLGGERVARDGALTVQHLSCFAFEWPSHLSDPGERRRLTLSLKEAAERRGGWSHPVGSGVSGLFFWSMKAALSALKDVIEAGALPGGSRGGFSRGQAWISYVGLEATVEGNALNLALEQLRGAGEGYLQVDPQVMAECGILTEMESAGVVTKLSATLPDKGAALIEVRAQVALGK
jgi:hypothetical protein